MITNKDILTWLKTVFPDIPKWGNSAFNKNDEKVITIYSRQQGRLQPVSIGMPAGYAVKSISLLVHWGKKVTPCEEKAIEVYKELNKKETRVIGGRSCWILANRAPVMIGRDEHGFYESVLDFDIYIRS